mgnify:FL=1
MLQKKLLEKLGLCISNDNLKNSIEILNQLCICSPFQTQVFVQVFINAWSGKILNMIDNNSFDTAGSRIRSLYMIVKVNKTFNKLIVIYFEKINDNSFFPKLKSFDKIIYLSMRSQYFYHTNKHEKAEKIVEECFKAIKNIIKKNEQNNDIWLLVRKCLKNIKNKKKSEYLLEQIL